MSKARADKTTANEWVEFTAFLKSPIGAICIVALAFEIGICVTDYFL